jgi:hypothetical protein
MVLAQLSFLFWLNFSRPCISTLKGEITTIIRVANQSLDRKEFIEALYHGVCFL